MEGRLGVNGAMTLSITAPRIMVFGIDAQHEDSQHNGLNYDTQHLVSL
jgi:hypothetical protein